MTAHSGETTMTGLVCWQTALDRTNRCCHGGRDAYASEIGENQSAALVALLKEACG